MAKIASWDELPIGVRQHLIGRMHDRRVTLTDLNALRLWMNTQPEVPSGEWYKDFGSFKLCGEGVFPKTFLLKAQIARGVKL